MAVKKKQSLSATSRDVLKEPHQKAAEKKAPNKRFHYTELGNMERMLHLYGENIRYSPAVGYLTWNGQYWSVDTEQEVCRYAVKTIRSMHEEAVALTKQADNLKEEKDTVRRAMLNKEAEDLHGWAMKSETSNMVAAMVKLAKYHCEVDINLFDNQPMLLNVANGTVNLRTGILHPHSREDYITQYSPYVYNPTAEAPTFHRFFSEIMLGRADLMHFVHKALGYGATGATSEQAWFMMLGHKGDNGKSTLLNTIKKAMGSYAHVLEPEAISLSKGSEGSGPNPEIADLKGKRFVTVSETEAGAQVRTQLMKKMTGEEYATARKLYKDPMTFFYTHKLFICTNHELIVRETGHAFWRRANRIPFDFSLGSPENQGKKDKKLPEKLEAEMEGILAWLVQGAMLWADEGLGTCETVLHATEEYRKEQNILGRFIEEYCVTGPNYRAAPTPLFKAFIKWQMEEMNMKSVSSQTFSRMVLDNGYAKGKSGANRYYIGLCLKSEVKTSMPTQADVSMHNGQNKDHTSPSSLAQLDSELSSIEGL